jgi:hypothetical protein
MGMAVFLGAFPVLAGKEDDVRRLAEETEARSDADIASQEKSSITSQEWALQRSPMGSLLVVRFECDDVEKAFRRFAESTDEFDVWQKGRIQEITGLDMSQPSDAPPPEIVHEWRA